MRSYTIKEAEQRWNATEMTCERNSDTSPLPTGSCHLFRAISTILATELNAVSGLLMDHCSLFSLLLYKKKCTFSRQLRNENRRLILFQDRSVWFQFICAERRTVFPCCLLLHFFWQFSPPFLRIFAIFVLRSFGWLDLLPKIKTNHPILKQIQKATQTVTLIGLWILDDQCMTSYQSIHLRAGCRARR